MIEGTTRLPRELDARYSRIFIGAAWPAVRPGYLVVVGEDRMDRVLGLPVLHVLDEAADERLWHVVERLAAMREYYRPERVLVDGHHVAAMQFAEEYRERGLRCEHSLLCAMEGPCGYAFPVLARLIEVGRLIVPPASRLAGELLAAPRREDLATLHLSEYPAISALAFAVLGLESSRSDVPAPSRLDTGRERL